MLKALFCCLFFLLNSPALAEDFLYLDPFLDMRAYRGEVEAYTEDYSTFYIATHSLKEVLEISLKIDETQLEGWFFYQNNPINGSFASNKITIGDQTFELIRQDVIEADQVWYLNTKTLTRWFGITIDVDVNRLLINFDTNGKHPFFEAIKRQSRYGQIDAFKNAQKQEVSYDNGYRWATWPSSDLRINHKLSGQKQTDVVAASVSDLLQHSVDFLANVNSSQTNYRLKLQREVKINDTTFNYEAGDIYFPAGKFLRASFSGRGIAIHGNQLSSDYAKNFQVEGLPGWQVELYRQDQLIDYSVLDERGQYSFEGVDISAGLNDYKAILYGPDGEVQEKHFEFNVSNLGLYQGKWLPEFYFLEADKPTLGDSSNSDPQFGKVAIGHLNYGLTNHINIGFGGIADLSDQGQDTPFAEFLYLGKDNRLDIGIAAPGFGQDIPYSVDYAALGDFGTLRLSNYKTYLFDGNKFQKGSSVGWQRAFNQFQTGISVNQQVFAGGKTTAVEASFGSQIGSSHIGNNLNWRNNSEYSLSTVARLTLDGHLIQLKASYDKTLRDSNKQLNASWRKVYGKHHYLVSADYGTRNKRLKLSADYSADFERFRLSARLAHDGVNQLSLSLSLSASFAWDAPISSMSPRSYNRSARIKTRAYLDKNNNGAFDDQDDPIAGVKYKGSSAWRNDISNANGEVMLYGAKSYQPQYLEVDTQDLDNPFISPSSEKFKITTHPGAEVAVDIAFYENFEIEGDVKFTNAKGETRGKSSVPIQLIRDGQVVAQVTSEYDGFFLFDNIRPGEYEIGIDQQYMDSQSLLMDSPKPAKLELLSGGKPVVMVSPFVLRSKQ